MSNLPLKLNSLRILRRGNCWVVEKDFISSDGKSHIEIEGTTSIRVVGELIASGMSYPINLLFKNEEDV